MVVEKANNLLIKDKFRNYYGPWRPFDKVVRSTDSQI